jgi:hypothetical protein
MFCLYSLVYFLPDFSYFLFMLFDFLSPRFLLYSVYTLWFTCSQILAIFCLYSLVYLPSEFGYILFILFGLLAPRFSWYSVYVLWFTCSRRFLNDLTLQSFDYECIWWRLFLKCVLRTKLDIYALNAISFIFVFDTFLCFVYYKFCFRYY